MKQIDNDLGRIERKIGNVVGTNTYNNPRNYIRNNVYNNVFNNVSTTIVGNVYNAVKDKKVNENHLEFAWKLILD